MREEIQRMLNEYLQAGNNNPEIVFAFKNSVLRALSDVVDDYISANLVEMQIDSPLGYKSATFLNATKDEYKIVYCKWDGDNFGYRGTTTIYFKSVEDAKSFEIVLSAISTEDGKLADNQTLQFLKIYPNNTEQEN